MEKILLAVGHEPLEKAIIDNAEGRFEVVNVAPHRGSILRLVSKKDVDVIIVLETLGGSEDIFEILNQLRGNFPEIRIIFISKMRSVGDPVLARLVSLGIYDIFHNGKAKLEDIIDAILSPRSFKDVRDIVIKHDGAFDLAEEGEVEIESELHKEVNNGSEKETRNENKNKQAPGIKVDRPEINIKIPLFRFSKNTKDKIGGQTLQGRGKILAFWGKKAGVGTTSVALSVAAELGKSGNQVVFVETDNISPLVPYVFNFGQTGVGLESCINSVESGDIPDIKNSMAPNCIKGEDSENAKPTPKNVRFLTFSTEYLLFEKSEYSPEALREVLLNLIYGESFDYVIVDLNSRLKTDELIGIMQYCDKVIPVITPEVSTLGYMFPELELLKKRGLNLEKFRFVMNKSQKGKFGIKHAKSWLDTEQVYEVSYACFDDAYFDGKVATEYSATKKHIKFDIGNLIKGIC